MTQGGLYLIRSVILFLCLPWCLILNLSVKKILNEKLPVEFVEMFCSTLTLYLTVWEEGQEYSAGVINSKCVCNYA